MSKRKRSGLSVGAKAALWSVAATWMLAAVLWGVVAIAEAWAALQVAR